MLSRLGLQKRIMLYVGIGLVIIFVSLFVVGTQAIDKGTDLVFAERLGIAQNIAAALANDFDHASRDTEEELAALGPDASADTMDALVRETLVHLAEVDDFSFFKVTDATLLDSAGRVMVSTWTDSAGPPPVPAVSLDASGASGPWAYAVEEGGGTGFVLIVVPLSRADGSTWASVVLYTEASSSSDPFVPYGMLGFSADDRPDEAVEPPEQTHYHLEVLSWSGTTLLGIGSDEIVGSQSDHHSQVHHLMESGESAVLFHEVGGEHVMAVVPVPMSDTYLILEQDTDVALALPNDFRRRLTIFGGLGFVIAMLVAWITTRHVVKPTEVLTKAAARMAAGELTSPIDVTAQDEVGVLAESLETMRLRLQTWGSELEEQVQQRTAELANRHRELRQLYDRLFEKEEQLRTLLSKVLGAQEDERKRLSRELHDGIGQALSAITMGLEGLASGQAGSSPEHLNALGEMARDSLIDLRRMTVALRPAALDDLGLVPAIRRYAELNLGDAGVEFELRDEGLRTRLDSSIETVVYRVVQEAVNNVVRHSGATHAYVSLNRANGTLIARVEDNGRGFDTSDAHIHPGVGLQGMQERASLAGGSLCVESSPGSGTAVVLNLPVREYAEVSSDV